MMHDKHRSLPTAEPFVRRHRSVFVGLFVLVPALAVPVLLIFTVVKSDLLQNWCTLYAVCENSEGLKKGNQVSMSGTAIGHVSNVDLVREGEVRVRFNINSRYKRLVKSDTKVRLKQRGFVGDWEVELLGGTSPAADAEDGDTLKVEAVPSMDGLIVTAMGIIDTATALLNDMAAIVKGIKEGEGTVGQLLKNDTLYRNINKTSAGAFAVTSNVNSSVGKIAEDIRGTVRNTDSLLTTINTLGKGGATLVDTLSALINTANGTIAQIGDILKNVKTVSDDVPEIMNKLQRDLDEAEYMLKSISEGWLFKQMSGPKPKNPHLAETP
jgi:phospholipid/cholesterol/gamma-HCH transport system substrate-binding protein